MAHEIKVTLTIEATLMRDVHAAIDAADKRLRAAGGRIVSGKLVPLTTRDKVADWKPAAMYDWHVTYRKIPTSFNQPVTTTVRAASSEEAEEIVLKGVTASIRIEDVQGVKVESAPADADADPHECAPDSGKTDAEANEQLVTTLAALPAYNGWRAAWEYPGYIAFHREGSPSVFATPDYHERGKIAVEVQDATGHSKPCDDITWPSSGRTHESYMALLRPVLDGIASPTADFFDDIFESVMSAMQPAEEIGGPEGAQYVALMERIAHEAQGRANRMRDALEPRQWEIKFNREHVGHTQYIMAKSREEADALWRARMIKDGETDVAGLAAKIEVRS